MRLPTPGTETSASRSSSARQRRSVDGECTDRIASASFGPTPLAVMSVSNVSRSSRVGESVEDERVFANVLVREQEHRRARLERGERVDRHEHPVPDAADLDEHLAAQVALDDRRRAASRSRPGPDRRGSDRASGCARDGSTRARARRRRRADSAPPAARAGASPSSAPRPCWPRRRRSPRASPRWGCTASPAHRPGPRRRARGRSPAPPRSRCARCSGTARARPTTPTAAAPPPAPSTRRPARAVARAAGRWARCG